MPLTDAHRETAFAYETAQARGDLVEIIEAHQEEHPCVLTPKWESHFRQEARVLLESQPALEREVKRLKRAVKDAEERLEHAKAHGGRMASALFCEPPQGNFEFTGRLVALRGTGYCILVGDDGEPILETYRQLTDKERAELSRLEDELRNPPLPFPGRGQAESGEEDGDDTDEDDLPPPSDDLPDDEDASPAAASASDELTTDDPFAPNPRKRLN